MIIRLEAGKTTIPGCVYGVVGWFPTVVRIRLPQPPAGAWLAWAWAELGNDLTLIKSFQLCSNLLLIVDCNAKSFST